MVQISDNDFKLFHDYVERWWRIGKQHASLFAPPRMRDGNIVLTHSHGDDWGQVEYLIISPTHQGFAVCTQGVNRGEPNSRGLKEFFSRFDWISKFVFFRYGDDVRMLMGKNPVNWDYLKTEPHDDFFTQPIQPQASDYKAHVYRLKSDPASYYSSAGGLMGNSISYIVNLSFQQIDELLHQDRPDE